MLGDEILFAAEVVNSETTSSKSVNTDEHIHLPLASVGTTSMSNEFNGNTEKIMNKNPYSFMFIPRPSQFS
jgi:hypothetical protein